MDDMKWISVYIFCSFFSFLSLFGCLLCAYNCCIMDQLSQPTGHNAIAMHLDSDSPKQSASSEISRSDSSAVSECLLNPSDRFPTHINWFILVVIFSVVIIGMHTKIKGSHGYTYIREYSMITSLMWGDLAVQGRWHVPLNGYQAWTGPLTTKHLQVVDLPVFNLTPFTHFESSHIYTESSTNQGINQHIYIYSCIFIHERYNYKKIGTMSEVAGGSDLLSSTAFLSYHWYREQPSCRHVYGWKCSSDRAKFYRESAVLLPVGRTRKKRTETMAMRRHLGDSKQKCGCAVCVLLVARYTENSHNQELTHPSQSYIIHEHPRLVLINVVRWGTSFACFHKLPFPMA